MKILVIGGTGFIGRHLSSWLAKQHSVTVLSRNPPIQGIKQLADDSIIYRQGDITQRNAVFAAMKGMDYVVNLSSTVIPSTSNSDPTFDVQTNLVGALNVLDAAVESHIKKMVFLSSGGTVYGEGKGLASKEGDATNPTCSYGIVKLAIEKYIQMYHQLYGLPYAILRVSNPYGPGQVSGKPLGAVSIFIDKVRRCQPIEIWGDGTAARDFIYISDLIYVINKSLFLGQSGVLLNIGSGVPTSLNELVKEISNVLELTPIVIYKPSRIFDVQSAFLDISKVQEVIKWRPSISLRQGIKLTADGY